MNSAISRSSRPILYVQDVLGSCYYWREAVSREVLITASLVMIEVAQAERFATIIRLDFLLLMATAPPAAAVELRQPGRRCNYQSASDMRNDLTGSRQSG